VNEAYDEAGNRTEGLYYRFHSLTNDWTAHWHYVYSYDPDGNRTEEVNYHWNSNTNSWVNDLRNLTSIDGNGNPEEEMHYVWDSGSNTWEYLKRVEHVWSDTVTLIPDTTSQSCGPCQNMTFTDPAGSLSDNSCDGEYDNFADCRKLIQVTDAEYIYLVFTEFNIEDGYDFVRVYDGPITSSQGVMLIHFTSDYSEIRTGWSAEYTSGEDPVCFNETFTEESGIVDDNSGDGYYMINADCQKLIMPEDVLNITLTFTELVMEDGYDYVRIYDGPTTGDELLGEYTGTSLPASVTSSGSSMLIHFTSDGSVNASGWAASYTSIPSGSGPCLEETYTNQTGSFSDNSCNGDYDNNADCRKLIQVPGADYIVLVFTEFNTETDWDFVSVYDGPTTGDDLLGEFTGTSLPGSITSS
jgi:cubilin